ncbi:MAG: hypothetical protein IJ655_00040 [Lachnospiraceae bacterium]|jgi:hypothetical protein|nr:hypothetical protein [Lachnospiraceae bacterium]
MNGLRRLNEALPGLVIGIIVYGLILQFTGVWFVTDKIRYSSGLWIGIGCAIGMAIHLAMVIEEAVRLGDGNTKRLSVKSVLRYAVVVIIIFIMMYFNLGNLITAFLGILGLKVSAYAQPFMHKVIFKDIEPDESQEEVEEEVKL